MPADVGFIPLPEPIHYPHLRFLLAASVRKAELILGRQTEIILTLFVLTSEGLNNEEITSKRVLTEALPTIVAVGAEPPDSAGK